MRHLVSDFLKALTAGNYSSNIAIGVEIGNWNGRRVPQAHGEAMDIGATIAITLIVSIVVACGIWRVVRKCPALAQGFSIGSAFLVSLAILWWPVDVNVKALYDWGRANYTRADLQNKSAYVVFSAQDQYQDEKPDVHYMPVLTDSYDQDDVYVRGARFELLVRNSSLSSEVRLSSVSLLLMSMTPQAQTITYNDQWPPRKTDYDPWAQGQPKDLTFVIFVTPTVDGQWHGIYQWYSKGVLEGTGYEFHDGEFVTTVALDRPVLELELTDPHVFMTDQERLLTERKARSIFGKVLVEKDGVYAFGAKINFEVDPLDERLHFITGWLVRWMPPNRQIERRSVMTTQGVLIAANSASEKQRDQQITEPASKYLQDAIPSQQDKQAVSFKTNSLVVFPISDVLIDELKSKESQFDSDTLRALCLKPKESPDGKPIPIIFTGNNPALVAPSFPPEGQEGKLVSISSERFSAEMTQFAGYSPVTPEAGWSFTAFVTWPERPDDPKTELLLWSRLEHLQSLE